MNNQPYMKPFHQNYPGMPQLFHTYCPQHPNWGTCAELEQANLDISKHLLKKAHS